MARFYQSVEAAPTQSRTLSTFTMLDTLSTDTLLITYGKEEMKMIKVEVLYVCTASEQAQKVFSSPFHLSRMGRKLYQGNLRAILGARRLLRMRIRGRKTMENLSDNFTRSEEFQTQAPQMRT